MSTTIVSKVALSIEALGKGAGIPSSRAAYALEVMLCTVGKEAGKGKALLVDCGVGVLATRGRVVKFTFVQVENVQAVLRGAQVGLL